MVKTGGGVTFLDSIHCITFHYIPDIDECAMGGFAEELCTQRCVNEPGSYHCECNIPGYTLFTEDGTEGFALYPDENGLLDGDRHQINHTCVRK